jgi:hypothetical protein
LLLFLDQEAIPLPSLVVLRDRGLRVLHHPL